jgi:hypothetical protein
MCLARRNLSPKARRFLIAGNLCLVFSLLLSHFAQRLGPQHANLSDALRGFLIGLSITFNIAAIRTPSTIPLKVQKP